MTKDYSEYNISPRVAAVVNREMTIAEGGYANPSFDGLHTMMGIPHTTLANHTGMSEQEAIAYIQRAADVIGRQQTIPESFKDGDITREDIHAANPSLSNADIAHFEEFLNIRHEIFFQDHIIAPGLNHVDPAVQLPIFDAAFHRGEAVAWWMMAETLNQAGQGNYPTDIPYHNSNQSSPYSNLSKEDKAEITAKFNQLVADEGRETVTAHLRDAKLKQHKHDIAQHQAGHNINGVPDDRSKHMEGWTNRVNRITAQNNFALDDTSTQSPQATLVSNTSTTTSQEPQQNSDVQEAENGLIAFVKNIPIIGGFLGGLLEMAMNLIDKITGNEPDAPSAPSTPETQTVVASADTGVPQQPSTNLTPSTTPDRSPSQTTPQR